MSIDFIAKSRIWGAQVYVLVNGILTGYWNFDHSKYHQLGSIFKARVVKLLPGLDAAMLDLGDGKKGFLKNRHLPAVFSQSNGWIRYPKENKTSISDKTRVGDILLVKIDRLPIGEKEYQVTADIDIQSLFWVCRPLSNGLKLLKALSDEEMSSIESVIGTSAVSAMDGTSLESGEGNGHWAMRSISGLPIYRQRSDYLSLLKEELASLRALWQRLAVSLQGSSSLGFIHAGLDWFEPIRTMLSHSSVNKQFKNDQENSQVNFWFSPKFKLAIDHFKHFNVLGTVHLLNAHQWEKLNSVFGLNAQVEKAARGKLDIQVDANRTANYKASLIFQQHEAMMTVDVNSGGILPGVYSETTLKFNINEQALKQIVSQICLKNIRGMILIDWISIPIKSWRRFQKKIDVSIGLDPWVFSTKHLPDKCVTLLERNAYGHSLQAFTSVKCHHCQGVGTQVATDVYARKVLDMIESKVQQAANRFQSYMIELNIDVNQLLHQVYASRLNDFAAENGVSFKWNSHRRGRSDFQVIPEVTLLK